MLAVQHPFDNKHSSSVGCSHSYFYYQRLNTSTKRKLEPSSKQIIPSIPRQKIKLPENSLLSPIRSRKFNSKQQIETKDTTFPNNTKRPYPLLTTLSSPAYIQTTYKKRHRKVSFDENVIVVCTVFDEDENEEEIVQRRHSTGETTQSKLLPPLTTKITNSLKQFKNRLSFV